MTATHIGTTRVVVADAARSIAFYSGVLGLSVLRREPGRPLYLDDPDGNGVEVYRDRPRSEWAHTPDGRIVMGTGAVDLAGLVGEADTHGLVWDRAPAGTWDTSTCRSTISRPPARSTPTSSGSP